MAGAPPHIPNPNYYAHHQDPHHLQLSNFNKIWDGMPSHEWKKDWMEPFFASLGNVRIDGSTLAQTAMATDIGSAGGNPAAAGASPAQLAQHAVRLSVLQQTILQHIAVDTIVYDLIMTDFAGEGRRAWQYICQVGVGPKALDPTRVKAMNKDWDAICPPAP